MAGTSSGNKAIGETEIKDKHGNLLVRFSSEDVGGLWGQRFEQARVKYAMTHRRDNIPKFLRTGKCPFLLKLIFTPILERKLKKEVKTNG